VTVVRLGESEFRVTTGTGSAASDLGWLRLHLPDDGVAIADVTERHAVIGVWGPDSRRTLARTSRADLSHLAFPYLTSRVVDVGGVDVRANRVSFAGELGYELVAPRDDAGRVWDAVMEAGRGFGIEPVGYHALDTLRLEKCFCHWGDDIGPGDTPLQANLGSCVRLDKGEFIGREALLRQRDRGLDRQLVPLVLDGEACVLWGGEAVVADGRVVGRVRSGGYGHTLRQNIALAYLPADVAGPGTSVSIESFGRLVPTEVRTAPLWDPRGARGRA
jgi:4-methylaminobutanoate oxidase (formaldehyde-forming)